MLCIQSSIRHLALGAIAVAVIVTAGACGSDEDPEVKGGDGTSTTEDRTSTSGGDAMEGSGDGMMDGGDSHMGGDHGESSEVAEGARPVEVTATSFEFDPDEIRVAAGEDIAIVLTSDDTLHDFTIDEFDAHVAAERGETSTGGFTATEPGEYVYYCTVSGHRAAGMEGTLIVE
jgi:plastocyanin